MVRHLACLTIAIAAFGAPAIVTAGASTTFTCKLEPMCDVDECQPQVTTYVLKSQPLMVAGKVVAEQAEPATLTAPNRMIEGRALHQNGSVFWNNRVRNETFEPKKSCWLGLELG